ncbi:hypothetical protein SAMN02745910_04658 [Priestia endophytica DSM 13796]|uniref:Uncharacterized protein n=1 Tax=Priestia endophytica DSM 13796 TaxID=1121089 RepID=A0A1I6C009_9BACI|nr:hypothetical protein SAMN02745910_04658 [Priestia endophytica DSM 13796]
MLLSLFVLIIVILIGISYLTRGQPELRKNAFESLKSTPKKFISNCKIVIGKFKNKEF